MDNEQTFLYSKQFGKESAIVVLNFTAEEQSFKLPAEFEGKVQLMHSNAGPGKGSKLVPYEARIYFARK
jgi:oligo-1,6-glucosidase